MASPVYRVVQAAPVLLDFQEILVLMAFPVQLDLVEFRDLQAILVHRVVLVLLVQLV